MSVLPDRLIGDVPCSRCGSEDFPVWFTDSPFWNSVVRSAPLPWLAETHNPQGDGLLCINCFVVLAEERGFEVTGWRLTPEFRRVTNS